MVGKPIKSISETSFVDNQIAILRRLPTTRAMH